MKTSPETAWESFHKDHHLELEINYVAPELQAARIAEAIREAFEAGFEAGREAALEYPDLFERGEPS